MHIRVRHVLAAIGAVAFTATASIASPAEAAPSVRFTRVTFDSPGNDTGTNVSLNAEWARIKNFGSSARTLTGWRLRDASGHVYVFPRFVLRPGATVTVHTGRGANTGAHLYWNAGNYIWNNNGDTATLKNASGTKIDSCSFSGAGTYKNC